MNSEPAAALHERETARLYTPQPVEQGPPTGGESPCRVQEGRLHVCIRNRQTGQLLPGMIYRIELADGSMRHGNLDEASCLREDDVPHGPVRIVLLGVPGLSMTAGKAAVREEIGLASPVLHSLAWSHGYALEGENVGLVVGVLGASADARVCFEVLRQGAAQPIWVGTAPVRKGRAACNWTALLADGDVDPQLERPYADYWFRVRYSDRERRLHAVGPLGMRVYGNAPAKRG